MSTLRLLTEAELETLTHDEAQAEYRRLMQEARDLYCKAIADVGHLGGQLFDQSVVTYHRSRELRRAARATQKAVTDVAARLEQINTLWGRMDTRKDRDDD